VFPFQLYHLDELSMLQESAEKVNADFPADSLLGAEVTPVWISGPTAFPGGFSHMGFSKSVILWLAVSNLPF
jgi:hypothetical protein